MQEDFKFLLDTVRAILPTTTANKKVYGIDVFQNLDRYGNKVSQAETTLEFVSLIDKAINSCKASHFSISSITAEEYRTNQILHRYIEGYVEEESLAIHAQYQQYIHDRSAQARLNIPLLYHKGRYYTKHHFSQNGKTYTRGLRVKTCNGQTPDEIVDRTADNHPRLPWDSDNHKFYSCSFHRDASTSGNRRGEVVFEFVDRKGATFKGVFRSDAPVVYTEAGKDIPRTVELLKPWKILYIRIPSMDPKDTPFYLSGIKESRDKKIEAVVIDIRNNSGGSDDVWRTIVSHLTNRKLACEIRAGAKNNDLNLSYLSRHGFGSKIIEKGKPERIGFLDNEEFLVLDMRMELEPAEDSIQYPGPIFVLSENVYSAAGSLVTFARQTDQISSVGLRNPYILGLGIDPYIFTLPHSKFIFRIEPVIDLTYCRKAEDIYHTDVEVEIHPSLDQLLDYHNCPPDISLQEFLGKHDPFFAKTLALIKGKTRHPRTKS